MVENETNIQARDRGYKDGYAGRPFNPGHDEHDTRSFAYMDGHHLGRLAMEPAPDIEWPLEGKVKIKVTRIAGNIYHIESLDKPRKCLMIKYNDQGRLLFDGHDIETESYMSYVGLMDEVVEQLGSVGVGTVTLDKEF